MDYFQGKYPIVKKENLSKNCYSFWIHCPELAAEAEPGQFCHMKAEGFSLRRPVSICEIDREKGNLRLVFEVRGEGTAVLAELPQGGNADVIGPLGNGFTLLEGKKAVLIGGGIGTPPMLELAKHYKDNGVSILGFRSKDAVILEPDFHKTGGKVLLCTDDGSAGRKDFVTEALRDVLASDPADIVYACGPKGMLNGVVGLCEAAGVRCEVSLEERMGCGVGACLVCACRCVRDGKEFYAHVCTDGPVFDAKEVAWND